MQETEQDDLQIDVPEEYPPSDWLTETTPLGNRYFPQVGDMLVYFRQGHQKHEEQVEKERKYKAVPLNYKNKLPYLTMPQMKVRIRYKVLTSFHLITNGV